jgi:hypothetical protein
MFKNPKYTLSFTLGFFFVFLKNVFFDVKLSGEMPSLVSHSLDLIVFWALLPDIKNRIVLFILSFLGVLGIYFLKSPIFGFDTENHIPRFILAALPFVFHIVYTQNSKRLIIPILMGLGSWINLELSLHFKGNISLLNLILNNLAPSAFFDAVFLSWVKACFLCSLIIIFRELDHQFFAWKSLRLYVEQTCNKRTMAILFFIFKPLMYWFIGSIILVFLGQNRIPIFENKFSLLVYGLSFGTFLFIYAVYFRKFISIYFYENLGINNFLYICLALPFVDIFACFVLLFFKNFQLKKWFHFSWSSTNLVFAQILILIGYIVYYYVTILKDIPSTDPKLVIAAYAVYVFIPLVVICFLYVARDKANRYRFLIFTLMLLGFVVRFVFLPIIESSFDILVLVDMFLNYFLILLAVFFIYPFLFLKNYLRIKD